MRESFVFYRSFFDAISDLDTDQQAEAYNAIFRYAFTGEEPDTAGVVSAVFKLVKPQIDANNRKRDNGSRGGRPNNQTETEEKPNDNQGETKTEPSNNQSVTKEKPHEHQSITKPEPNVNVNDNVNVNVNVNENEREPRAPKHKHGDYGHVLLTDGEYNRLRSDYGEDMTLRAIRYLDEYIEMKGAKYKSCYLAIRKWVVDAVKEKQRSSAGGLPYSVDMFD